MKRLSLLIASIVSLLAIPVCLVLGLDWLFQGEIGWALAYFAGAIVSLAHAVVFDFVGTQLEKWEKEQEKNPTPVSKSDLTGTPWASNSNHTLD